MTDRLDKERYNWEGKIVDFDLITRVLGKVNTELLIEKNHAYGNSVEVTQELMRILYPEGISPEQYDDSLFMIRILDKLMRIANDKKAFGEDPWADINGYALLARVGKYRVKDAD